MTTAGRWQPTLLLRASVLIHIGALLAVLLAPAEWRWALAAVLANHALLAAVGLWPRSSMVGCQRPAAFPLRCIMAPPVA